jgi:hypothetical protein
LLLVMMISSPLILNPIVPVLAFMVQYDGGCDASSDSYWGWCGNYQLNFLCNMLLLFDDNQSIQPSADVSHCPHSTLSQAVCWKCLPMINNEPESCDATKTPWIGILFAIHHLWDFSYKFSQMLENFMLACCSRQSISMPLNLAHTVLSSRSYNTRQSNSNRTIPLCVGGSCVKTRMSRLNLSATISPYFLLFQNFLK